MNTAAPNKEFESGVKRILLGMPYGSLLDFAGGAAAFTLVPEGAMLATSDFTVKLLAPAIGDRFVGKGRVLSATRSTTVSRADVFAVKGDDEILVATGLVRMRTISRGAGP